MQGVRELVERLAKLAPGPLVATLYLDTAWRDEQQRERVRVYFEEQQRRARQHAGDDSEALTAALAQLRSVVEAVVNQETAEQGEGFFVVSSPERGLFETIVLSCPVNNGFFIDERPRLSPLIEAGALAPPVLLIAIESPEVRLFELSVGRVVDEQEVARDVPRRHAQGGWSQRNFQRHVREHIAQVWQHGADVAAKMVREDGVAGLVLMGQTQNVAGFERLLDAPTRSLVAGRLPLPEHRRDILAAAQQVLSELRMEHDSRVIHQILGERLGEGSAAVGLTESLLAVNERRAWVLALTPRFEPRGYLCERCDALWESGSLGCVFCGGPTRLVPLREELVRRTLSEGGDLVITPDASPLDVYRGVGVLLRRLSADARRPGSIGVAPAVSPEFAHRVTR